MRSILTLMAIVVMTITIGCAPEATQEAPAASDSTSTESSATTAVSADLQEVSLKLPGMT